MSQELISHKGIVTEVNQDIVRVSIVAESACGACHARGFCSLSETQEKIIETSVPPYAEFRIGDVVEVTLSKTHGQKAVFYGYVLPFFLLMIALLTAYHFTGDEGIAGLSALGILVPYYFILYLLRDRLRSQFRFGIRR